MPDSNFQSTVEWAPHPWKIEDHDSEHWGYLSIVDASGNKICDFFPHAAKGGRGVKVTLDLARQIIEWERANAKCPLGFD